jgi:2-aminoethylphosphonate-pyruvate transaminase
MILLTPGPVQTRPEVKAAMLEDIAPWDEEFREFYARLKARVLALAGGVPGEHAALPLQGSGHMAVEAAIRTFVPRGGSVLIPMSGEGGAEYAQRAARLARDAGRVVVDLPVPDTRAVRAGELAEALERHPECGHVLLIHSETGSGVVNDPRPLGPVVRAAGRRLILDSVSGFGGLPFSIADQPECDAVVFTSNKCLEGLPGFAWAVADLESCARGTGNAESWSLDLADLAAHARKWGEGSLRFTGPVQTLKALSVALDLLDAEGLAARQARYAANARTLYAGLRDEAGLVPYLEEAEQGPIIVTMRQPEGVGFDLLAFVRALKRRGVTISAYHTSAAPSLRVGAIGAVGEAEMRAAVAAIAATMAELRVARAA